MRAKAVRVNGRDGGSVVRAPIRSPKGGTVAEIVQALRERIAAQGLPPGSKLHEAELSAEFGVSRARIRDVLAALEQRALIRRIPNRGAVVVRLELNQVFEIYDVREMLEGLCARLAAENAPGEPWQEMIEFFAGPMAEHVERGDLESYLSGLEKMRRQMVKAAANPVLANMLDSIRDQTRAIVRRIIILPGRASVGLREHRAILEALRAGDPEAAERAARANIRSARELLKRYQSFVL